MKNMKYAIFGTGKYYERYRRYINDDDVLFLLDNAEGKWGKIINGKEVVSPKQVNYDACDFILVMIMQYEQIEEQLISYGVAKEKIKNYQDIPSLYNLTLNIESAVGRLDFETWKRNQSGKKIFVCSPEFSRTGVPVALMHVCKMFKEMGYEVLFAGLVGGTLEEELSAYGIDYIKDLGLFYRSDILKKILQEFDMIFLGGLGTSGFGRAIYECDLPIVWWLHESDDRYYEKHKLVLRDNVHYFAGGRRVVEKFNKHYKNVPVREMLYFLPNLYDREIVSQSKEKITLAVIGSVIKRKGQDIFVQAIKQIDEEKKKGADFVIVGSYDSAESWGSLKEQIKEIDNLVWIDELSQKELEDFYKKVDVLVCPSRDDPMPIVVTQAFQNGIPCIVSNQVGQCEYLVDGQGGDVFDSEDVMRLSEVMSMYIEDRELVRKKGIGAKSIFLKYFSEEAMRKNLEFIVRELMR